MQRCLDLARMGQGNTGTNPMVGAVIVYNGNIIGEGYHKRYGEPHAEANAINAVKDKSLLKKSTLYVNLEPCSHLGKTPPCSELIINNNIPAVIIGSIDPNSIVSGKGLKKLNNSGIKVIKGILENKCIELNKRFFIYYKKKRPFIILKWAQTIDGYIDTTSKNRQSSRVTWISNNISRMLVHKWRAEEHAIMVGTKTALMDNPQLNIRYWSGNNPLRIVLDRTLRLPYNLNLFDKTLNTIVFTEKKQQSDGNTEYIRINFNRNILEEILEILFHKGIQSVIVEGGKMLLESFIEKQIWDEARVIIGNKEFKAGTRAPVLPAEPEQVTYLANDRLLIFNNNTLNI
ncbi:MAG: bifunctional diaminohydroxyphosphoribosylaminopyrimidine deaminase/5-amino-6-(5-phosphoribosylamino)uracil reductase RibD [Bacteroidales bacterium]|nr:MAG: bifunctional diaminohydroxyphosphoribosylaminopyrimidine deaminase/5-amino-6-(5-phosphoribosylamino)uracil reductase RibD [Bacteroidales bacterium]